MSIRTRRLMADYEKVLDDFAGHKYIMIKPVEGNPPVRYIVTYKLKGLKLDTKRNCPVETFHHEVEIYLHKDYPREKPQMKMKTEIFHPNFGTTICIADDWTAGQKLADIILQIGEMIQYQNYNVKSPMNAVAARWVMENEGYLPIDNVNLYQAEPEININIAKENEKNDDLDIQLF